MSTTPRINLVGFYNYDGTLFDHMRAIEGVDKKKLIDAILLTYGEMPVLYSNPYFMKNMIGVWWDKWEESFKRIYEAISAEYNPIHNYDRFEEYSDTENSKRNTDTKTETSSDTKEDTKEETLNDVSAFNEKTYSPDRRTTAQANATGTAKGTAKGTNVDDMHRDFTHKAHLYGNIGVTTSGQMQLETMDIYSQNNIYDIIAGIFADEFILKIY